ncbi:uncharacterized protein LOC130759744 [Actinidia eriantha]|uniref:uncharacterized protein LOC130759744 n=1 Tax=Actinidia eriantha TaxID=165200 RepID=UPI00258B3BEB|nr:uncharacterized protein LOC130759744 [Actinidia eriantha]
MVCFCLSLGPTTAAKAFSQLMALQVILWAVYEYSNNFGPVVAGRARIPQSVDSEPRGVLAQTSANKGTDQATPEQQENARRLPNTKGSRSIVDCSILIQDDHSPSTMSCNHSPSTMSYGADRMNQCALGVISSRTGRFS